MSDTDMEEHYNKGRQKGLDEALEFITKMEQRYRQWASGNPGLMGMEERTIGKLDAVTTAKRAIEKFKTQRCTYK